MRIGRHTFNLDLQIAELGLVLMSLMVYDDSQAN